MTTQQTITGAEIGLLSYLFEAVGDLLTPAQRQELTDQLTSLRPAGVAPGDLITAELFNAMLNNINDLLARVAALEGTKILAPVITEITPLGRTAGQTVTMLGQNLNKDLIDQIQFDNVNVLVADILDGSSDTRLVVQVPAVPNIGTGGRFVEVSVSNAAGTGSHPYFLAPATSDVLTSNFVVNYLSGFPLNVPISGNADVLLNFNIVGSASRAAAFNVVPTIDPPTAGWTVSMDTGDEVVNMIGNDTIQTIPVQVRLRTGGTGAAAIKFAIRAQSNASIGVEQVTDTYTVGLNPPLSVPGISMQGWAKSNVSSPISISGNNVYFDDSAAATDITIRRTINISNGKTFTVGTPQISPNSGWTATIIPPPVPPATATTFNGTTSLQHTLQVRLRFIGTFVATNPTQFDRQLVIPLTSEDGTALASASIKVRANHLIPVPA